MHDIKTIKIERFPKSRNNSLKAWNAADEYLIKYWYENKKVNAKIAVYNDRFGFITTNLYSYSPISIIDFKSQEKAIKYNLDKNSFVCDKNNFFSPLDNIETNFDMVFVKVPKALDLFRLYLSQIVKYSNENTVVVCAFMTKNFSGRLLKIGEEYFNESEQSIALKKARLLILKKPKPNKPTSIINTIKLSIKDSIYQYYGVFSAHNIDYATQFLLQNIELNIDDKEILDLASGNGVIAYHIAMSYKKLELNVPKIHLIDDSFLAIESSKLNLKGDNFYFYFNDNLEDIKDNSLDLIVTNPPFHFDYEINTETTFGLFSQSKSKLKSTGRLIIVANRHLNYISFLKALFLNIKIVAENSKFVVIECEN